MTDQTNINPQSYAQQGETLRRIRSRESDQEALNLFSEAIDEANRQGSKYSWAYAHRGATYLQLSNLERALEDLTEAIDNKPDYAWAFAHRGETYRQMVMRGFPRGSWEQAVEDLKTAIRLDPQYTWAFAHLGATYYEWAIAENAARDDERWQKALDALTEAIEKTNREYAWAYAYRGIVYWRGFDDSDKARNDWDIARFLNPNIFPNSFNQQGLLCILAQQYDRAIECFQQALKDDSENTIALYGIALAKTRKSSNRVEEARTEIDKARAVLEKNCCVALYQLAALASLEGETELISNYIQQANLLREKVVGESALPLGGEVASFAVNDLSWLGMDDDERFQELIC